MAITDLPPGEAEKMAAFTALRVRAKIGESEQITEAEFTRRLHNCGFMATEREELHAGLIERAQLDELPL